MEQTGRTYYYSVELADEFDVSISYRSLVTVRRDGEVIRVAPDQIEVGDELQVTARPKVST